MHCPNCGAESSARQKFCRACGLSLERFAQLLAELLPDGEDENVTRARQRLRQLEKALKIAGWTAGSSSLNKQVSGSFPSQPTLPSAETTNKLLSEDQSRIAMSVTEQTTARLNEKVGESR